MEEGEDHRLGEKRKREERREKKLPPKYSSKGLRPTGPCVLLGNQIGDLSYEGQCHTPGRR